MLLTFDGPFAGRAELSVPTTTPECHYCGSCRQSMQSMELCVVCKRPEIPSWLAAPKVHVGMRFILRGAVSNLMGVVTRINVLKQTVSVVAVSKSSPSARHATFTKVDLNAAVVTPNLHPLPSESQWHRVLDAHGLCSQCGHVYHIHRIPDQPTMETVAEQLRTAHDELEQLVATKIQRKADHATSREMVQLSTNIKTQQENIWQLQKRREQDQGAWCPLCGHCPQAA